MTEKHKYLFKNISQKTIQEKSNKGLCMHWGCTRPKRSPHARVCNTCHSRIYRINSPKRYAYRQIKDSASKRGHPFTLTFDEFLEFDKKTGYCEKKGKDSDSLTIDRIDPKRGYSFDNIRALTWMENCSKKLDGMTCPFQPIAAALAKVMGDQGNEKEYHKLAEETLELVEVLQRKLAEEDSPF